MQVQCVRKTKMHNFQVKKVYCFIAGLLKTDFLTPAIEIIQLCDGNHLIHVNAMKFARVVCDDVDDIDNWSSTS